MYVICIDLSLEYIVRHGKQGDSMQNVIKIILGQLRLTYIIRIDCSNTYAYSNSTVLQREQIWQQCKWRKIHLSKPVYHDENKRKPRQCECDRPVLNCH